MMFHADEVLSEKFREKGVKGIKGSGRELKGIKGIKGSGRV